MVDHVFQFDESAIVGENPNNQGPPKLVAPGGTKGGLVDVVNSYYWTYSKTDRKAREETPTLFLKEKELKTNALVAQLLYTIGAAGEGFTEVAGDIVGQQNVESFKSAILKTFKTVASTSGVANSSIGKTIQTALDRVKDENPTFEDQRNIWLQPYKNLYLTKDTGWEFNLPYFENFATIAQNIFSQDSGPGNFLGMLSSGADLLTNAADIASVLREPTQISYVERSKFFNYPTEGEDFTFMFPLINTGSSIYADVIKNWQLIYLLLYNNRPARKNASVIEQPKVYEVSLPGVKYIPFAYISNISIDFQGARRQMKIPRPPGTTTRAINSLENNYDAVIPDAYIVKISLKGLIAESRNFMYHMLSPDGPVQVLTKQAADNTIIDQQYQNQLNIINSNPNIEILNNTGTQLLA